MLAIDWDFAITLTVGLLVVGLTIYGINRTRKIQRIILRVALESFCVVLALLGSLFIVLFLAANSFNNNDRHSALIYSPSRKIAVRTNDFDYGATGGDTSVTLHWAYGLRSHTIYFGDWKSVRSKDIQWKSDSSLTIYYDARYEGIMYFCSSTSKVKVICVPR
jgi:hypothetical protein